MKSSIDIIKQSKKLRQCIIDCYYESYQALSRLSRYNPPLLERRILEGYMIDILLVDPSIRLLELKITNLINGDSENFNISHYSVNDKVSLPSDSTLLLEPEEGIDNEHIIVLK